MKSHTPLEVLMSTNTTAWLNVSESIVELSLNIQYSSSPKIDWMLNKEPKQIVIRQGNFGFFIDILPETGKDQSITFPMPCINSESDTNTSSIVMKIIKDPLTFDPLKLCSGVYRGVLLKDDNEKGVLIYIPMISEKKMKQDKVLLSICKTQNRWCAQYQEPLNSWVSTIENIKV